MMWKQMRYVNAGRVLLARVLKTVGLKGCIRLLCNSFGDTPSIPLISRCPCSTSLRVGGDRANEAYLFVKYKLQKKILLKVQTRNVVPGSSQLTVVAVLHHNHSRTEYDDTSDEKNQTSLHFKFNLLALRTPFLSMFADRIRMMNLRNVVCVILRACRERLLQHGR